MQGAPNLEYAHAGALEACLDKHKGHVLGLVAFGKGIGAQFQTLQPAPLWVHIPVLGTTEASFEVWTSGSTTAPCGRGSITAHTDGNVLFGSMQIEQPAGATLEGLTRQAYLEIFAFLKDCACPNLLRIWNYLPRINDPENGLERYRGFNMGRHDAFALSGRDITEENVPAASVLGCRDGPAAIYFLASREPGKPVDNPRQLTAYRYPEQYGPRSPIFVRAMLASARRERRLMISGTASIVGHETVHRDDVAQQAQEILRNIRMLMRQAYPDGVEDGHMELKVYVRHPQDLDTVRKQVDQAFGAGQHTIYLQSDICRTDLLVEIEGMHFRDVRA